MTRLKNVDRNGNPIKSGARVEFDGLGLPVERGVIKYDRRLYGWHFVADDGNIHAAVVEWRPGKRIFKYYRRIE